MEGRQRKHKAPPALLVWKVVHERMPWNIVLLLGGGYALATGSEVKKRWRIQKSRTNEHYLLNI